MANLSAAIVSYNGFEEVDRAVRNILTNTTEPLDFYLIDNASPDGTGAELAKASYDGCVQVLQNEQNVGFGSGHNRVLPLLQSRYHFVINPDITVDSDVLGQMAAFLDENPDIVMATPSLCFPDGRPQVLPKRACNLLGLLSRQKPDIKCLQKYGDRYAMLDQDLTKVTDIQFCTGSFFIIRTSVFQQMGGFDEGYFMYVEDADITRKAMKYGRVCYLPQFKACHAWHRSPNKDRKQFVLQCKSMMRYFRKWGFRLVP